MSKPIVFVDMDGVLCNFIDGVIHHCKLDCHHDDIHAFNEIDNYFDSSLDMWMMIDAVEPNFWANLDEYPWTDSLLNIIEASGLDWYLLTSPSQ